MSLSLTLRQIVISGQNIFPAISTVGLCEKSRENNRNVESDRRETDKILVYDVVESVLPSVIIFLLLDIKKVYKTIQVYIEGPEQRYNNNNNKHK